MSKQKPVFGPERPSKTAHKANTIPNMTPEFFHTFWIPLVEAQLIKAGGIEEIFNQNPIFRQFAQDLLNERGLEIANWVKENCDTGAQTPTQIVNSFQDRINASQEETPLAGKDSEESLDS